MDARSHILLSGGTGFFGRALLRHLQDSALRGPPMPTVTVLTRTPQRFVRRFPEFDAQPWLRFHQADILRPVTLPSDARFTHVLHAATESTIGPQLTPITRFQQIVEGTRNLLDLAVSCQAKRFLLTSSGAVYGPQPAHLERVDETWLGSPDPLNPANAYGMGKRMAEHLCALYAQAHGLEIVVARCFAFVGPDLPLDVHFAIGNFIRDALHAESITVQGDGSPLRSYMDQRDLAQWLSVMLFKGQAGQAYNVGSDRTISVLELAHTVRNLIAPEKQVTVLGAPNHASPRNRYVSNIAKARDELGLKVTISLEDAIRYAANSHLRDSLPL